MSFVSATRSTAAGTVLALLSFEARANCARPAGYEVSVSGHTVTICPINLEGRECPDPDGMLRQGSTATSLLADRCTVERGTSCYVDECVPDGEYKYGFVRPYQCCQYCCGTDYYETVRVGAGPSVDCTPDAATSANYSGDLPWQDTSVICNYAGGMGGGGAGGTGGAGGQADGGGQADAGVSSESSETGCACTVGAGARARQLVFGANALVVLLGLALHRRRRLRG